MRTSATLPPRGEERQRESYAAAVGFAEGQALVPSAIRQKALFQDSFWRLAETGGGMLLRMSLCGLADTTWESFSVIEAVVLSSAFDDTEAMEVVR